jgi:hypothetical protein
VRSIPAIEQRGIVQSRIGWLGPRLVSRRSVRPCPAEGPCRQLGDNDKRADCGDGYCPGAAVRKRVLALADVVAGRRGLMRLVPLVGCWLYQLALKLAAKLAGVTIAAFDLDAPLVVCAEIDGEVERDQGTGEQNRADQHVTQPRVTTLADLSTC